MRRISGKFSIAATFLVAALAAGAAQNPPAATAPAPMAAPPLTPYGVSIGIDDAKKAAAAALAEARRNSFLMVVAIADISGNLVYLEKMDGAQNASVTIAAEKARSSALFRRPTKAFQDAVAQGGVGLRFLGIPGAIPVEGGIPLIAAGKIIGAIGLSGGASDQDAQCAQAGAAVIK